MHPNAATLARIYATCAALDHATKSKHAPEAQFQDPAFALQGQNEMAGIWCMLCEATRSKGLPFWKLEFSGVEADANTVHFHVCVVDGVFRDVEGFSGNPEADAGDHEVIPAVPTVNSKGGLTSLNDSFCVSGARNEHPLPGNSKVIFRLFAGFRAVPVYVAFGHFCREVHEGLLPK